MAQEVIMVQNLINTFKKLNSSTTPTSMVVQRLRKMSLLNGKKTTKKIFELMLVVNPRP